MLTPVAVPKSRIRDIIDGLLKEYRVVAPVRSDKLLEFKEIRDAGEVVLSDEITYKSPKEFLFPQVERLMRFCDSGEIVDEVQAAKTIILGIKPCDLEALKILTAVFTRGKFVDTCFLNHLDNSIFVGMGCISEKPGCFCRQRGIDRKYSRDCDLFLSDRGDNYLIEAFSEKGNSLMEQIGTAGSAVGNTGLHDETSEPSGEKILEIDADENRLFNDINWEQISEKCMACGTCTFICPTCHCFEFKDMSKKGVSIRYRCWDSCMYPRFTLHASGHNPRQSKTQRYRQRIMHKYLYVKENFGYTACTGCGRCIRSCPAGMNIRNIVSGIMEEIGK